MKLATDNGMAYGADRAYDEDVVDPEAREELIDQAAHRIRLECQHLSGAAAEVVDASCDDSVEFVEQVVRAVTRNYDYRGQPQDARIGAAVRELVERLIRAHAAHEVDQRRGEI